MSKVISALNGQRFEGAVTVKDLGPRGMITLRGDLSSAALKKAATHVSGAEMPQAGMCTIAKDQGIAWMSPDELLVVLPYADVDGAIAKMGKTLKDTHHLLADVSDARSIIRVQGTGVRDVIAKLSPADMRPSSFAVGTMRRTRMAQVAAAFWMRDARTIDVICFRSVSEYVFGILSAAAAKGAEVYPK